MWGPLQVEGVEDPKMSETDNEGNLRDTRDCLGMLGENRLRGRWRVGSDE